MLFCLSYTRDESISHFIRFSVIHGRFVLKKLKQVKRVIPFDSFCSLDESDQFWSNQFSSFLVGLLTESDFHLISCLLKAYKQRLS